MLNPAKQLISPFIQAWGKHIERRRFTRPPIVIGGCARSGTTMLLALMGAHPSVLAFTDELGFLNKWRTDTDTGKPDPFRMDRKYRELIRCRIPPTTTRWCEKSPANVRHIGKILDHFEEDVCFVHIIRDPRDVLISEHPEPGRSGDYYVPPERWVNDVSAGWEYQGHPSVLTLYYEDLVLRTDATIDQLLKFIGEERVQEMDDWAGNTNVRDNSAWEGGVKPTYPSSIGKWRKEGYEERIREVLKYPGLQDLMERCGYSFGPEDEALGKR